MKKLIAGLAMLASASAAHADIYLLDSDAVAAKAGHAVKPGDKPRAGISAASLGSRTKATGSVALTDSQNLRYFVNTNITFSTSSSASGAASEASYTAAVAATTSGGGTTSSTLNDAYDGYQSICVSLNSATGPCVTGDANYVVYRNNGAATVDASVPATAECTGRQYVFGNQTIGGLSVNRKVYVPNNDNFIRWMNSFTNTTGSPITFTMITGNNLGSDSNTRFVMTSSGDAVATTADTWVTSFQNYSGSTSSDPRLAHVLAQAGAEVTPFAVNFVDGDDNPYWSYQLTLAAGETARILNFGSGLPSKAAAAAKAAQLAAFPDNAKACLSQGELSEVKNFVAIPPFDNRPEVVPTFSLAALLSLLASVSIAGWWFVARRTH